LSPPQEHTDKTEDPSRDEGEPRLTAQRLAYAEQNAASTEITMELKPRR
jgi:hypothetical protein